MQFIFCVIKTQTILLVPELTDFQTQLHFTNNKINHLILFRIYLKFIFNSVLSLILNLQRTTTTTKMHKVKWFMFNMLTKPKF